LVTLPRSPTVAEILEEFKQHVLNSSPQKYFYISRYLDYRLTDAPIRLSLRDPQVVLPTVVSGLQVYFDKALGSNLLYRFERPQYADIRKRYVTGPTVQVSQEREMSDIYGAEHLLRMIGLSSFEFVAQFSTYSAASELASDGSGVYYGPRERRIGERLCVRTDGVSAAVILAR
jgi:MRG